MLLGLKIFSIVAPCVLLVDLLWLGVIMKGFYAQEMGDLLRKNGESLAPRWGAAILVYLLIPAGVIIFVRPLLGDKTPTWQTFAWGALFGLTLYGVYDLTNLATLEKWTLKLTIADMLWGGVLCGGTAILMQVVERWLTSK